MEAFEALFCRCGLAFKQSRTMLRAKDLAYGVINCVGRHTVTGFLSSCGKLFEDWSADYRIFQQDRMRVSILFDVIRQELISRLCSQQPIFAHMDDTLLKKSGKKIAGTGWRRDPLGPPFHTNFIWGQRFIQLSISLPERFQGACAARAIPVGLHHAPTVKKPKKTDGRTVWEDYKEKQQQAKLSKQGVERIKILRHKLDQDGAKDRQLVISVDGSYSNGTVLKALPQRTALIGRIRKDTVLNQLPGVNKTVGRNRVYGEQLPTPEEIRQSEAFPWIEVKAYAAGKHHSFKVKVLKDIRWRKAGKQDLQLVVVRPLCYRLTKHSRLLYRKPAYLICTDPKMDVTQLLQAYLWRWGIEVNFRDEKTVLGCGQAQVRTPTAVEKVPAFITAIYAMLLLAAHQLNNQHGLNQLPRSKWYPKKEIKKPTTGDIINQFRSQLFAKGLQINFTHFVNLHMMIKSRKIRPNPAQATLFYTRK